jgi:hypothetical protein
MTRYTGLSNEVFERKRLFVSNGINGLNRY